MATARVFAHEIEWKPAFWRKLDPVTATFGIALWVLTNAFSFLTSDDLQSQPLMFYIRQIGFSDLTIALVMLGNCIMLIASLVLGPILVLRASVASVTFIIWMLFGCAIVGAGLRFHAYPASGLFDIVCGVVSIFCLAQWALRADHE